MSVAIDPVPPQLPEEEFWEKYNRRLEFPLSTVGTVFMHVMVAAGLFVVMNYLIAKPENKDAVPISFAMISGEDDSGSGSDGDGKGDDTIVMGSPQDREAETPPDLTTLPPPNPNQTATNLPVPKASNAPKTAFAGGGTQGNGGKGPGGTGNEGKLARQENWNHWVISFSTFEGDGKDYLYQLGAFGAILVIPHVNQNHVYESLGKSFDGRMMSPSDTNKLTSGFHLFTEDPSLYSNDPARASKSHKTIVDVQRALKLDFTPEKFLVFFPKDVETLLTNKENAFIVRVRAETQLKNFDMQSMSTIVFAVDRKSGGKEVDVVRATLKEGGKITVQNGRIIVGR